MKPLTWFLGRAWDTRAWRREHARLLWFQVAHRNRNGDEGLTDSDHVTGAAEWLARAQDVTSDGGVAGRYRLAGGWTSSYPETTGYIIPTFLALSQAFGDDRFKERAKRCVDFLLRLQLPSGAFPGGEIHENTTQPSVFNTAQILGGLNAWHEAEDDPRVLEATRRAADWLLSVQDADGAWRQHVYGGIATTYSAHASCWLAEYGAAAGAGYANAAGRHLDWVLRHYDAAAGWFDLAGFSVQDHDARRAVLHTIAYTLWGVLRTSELLGRQDGIAAVETAATAAARRLELSGWLPGVLDHRWRAAASYACLTGNAQMALVWFRLFRIGGNALFLNSALKALDLVKRAHPMFSSSPDLRGGVQGSDPVWGGYVGNAVPNWAAKFFVDALLEKQRVLTTIGERPRGRWHVPADVPTSLPEVGSAGGKPLRVVLYTSPASHKVPQMLSRWSSSGFRPTAVVSERGAKAVSLGTRIIAKIRDSGLRGLLSRLVKRADTADATPTIDVAAYCRTNRIAYYEVTKLDSPEGCALIASLTPDLAVHAGAGILRAPVLAVPRIGTLNAHMGLLPRYRGMNVAEWSAFNEDPIGCSVHLMDAGIDTGPILCVRPIDARAARSIPELRRMVDDAQIALLGEVIQFVARSGVLPPARSQRADEGITFYRMHAELAAVLESDLRRQQASLILA